MRQYKEFLTDMERTQQDFPERTLWLAVIERALKDYCFFFDHLLSTNGGRIVSIRHNQKNCEKEFNAKAIAAISRLRWFLFSREPAEFNLEYLADHLFEKSTGMVSDIRKEAAKQFKRHIEDVEKANRFQAILYYVKESTGAYNHTAAINPSKLRIKRQRLI